MRRTTDPRIGIGAPRFVLPALLALLIAVMIAPRRPFEWEIVATRTVASLPDALAVVFWPVMQLGNRGVAVAIAVVAIVRSRRLGLSLLVAAITAWSAGEILKHVIDRPRPAARDLDGYQRVILDTPGFPSTHSAIAASVVTVVLISRHAGTAPRYALASAPLMVAVARLYYGVHFPLDVVGGVLLGHGAALAVVTLGRPPTALRRLLDRK